MPGLIDDLVDIMSKENEIYKDLIPIASKKTNVIIKNDLTALQDITDQEQLVIEQINSLERKREEVIKNIGTVLGKDPRALDMKTLIKIMGKQPKEQLRLSRIHDELKGTLKSLVMINDRNKVLIEQSLEMIEFNINLLQSSRMMPEGNNYDRNAGELGLQGNGTRMFDAKQ